MNTRVLVKSALKEDIPSGDKTTDSLGCAKLKGKAQLVAKQELVLSGSELLTLAFKEVDRKTKVHWFFKDGERVFKGGVVCDVEGSLASLLKAERTALNFLGHLSGVATLTSKFVDKTQGTKTKITDTRKTTPGFRRLEKKAVKDGGGVNHRMGLSDGILVKENHIRAAGGIVAAVLKIRKKYPKMPIEVEVTNLEEVQEALGCRVERLLLDNMSNELMDKAVRLINGRCLIEASGNMTLDRIEAVARLGVDFISVGQLTHSAPVADLSLLFVQESK